MVNYIADNKLKFDYNSSLANYHIKYPQTVVNFDLNKGKQLYVKCDSGLICLCHGGYSDSKIKIKRIKLCKANISPNREVNSTSLSMYCTTRDAKVSFLTL